MKKVIDSCYVVPFWRIIMTFFMWLQTAITCNKIISLGYKKIHLQISLDFFEYLFLIWLLTAFLGNFWRREMIQCICHVRIATPSACRVSSTIWNFSVFYFYDLRTSPSVRALPPLAHIFLKNTSCLVVFMCSQSVIVWNISYVLGGS